MKNELICYHKDKHCTINRYQNEVRPIRPHTLGDCVVQSNNEEFLNYDSGILS